MSFGARPTGYSASFGVSQPTSWTNRSSPSFGMYSAASDGNNFIVGGAGSGSQGSVYYSTDSGTTWTLVTLSSTSILRSAIWANSQYVVGGSGATATSSDGITWSVSTQLASTSYSTSSVNALIYTSAYGYLAVGTNGAAAVSTNGSTWTYRGGMDTAWGSTGIAANCGATDGSIYCVGGDSGRIATTTDTSTWTDRNYLRVSTPWSTSTVRGMAYGAGKFVIVGGNSGGTRITAYSSDGVTWTYNGGLPIASGANPNNPALCVIWTGSFFIAGSYDGNIATSPDGITWTSYPALYNLSGWSTREVAALANNSSTIVAAGWESGGGGGRIATSP